jgi:hypothetical protein
MVSRGMVSELPPCASLSGVMPTGPDPVLDPSPPRRCSHRHQRPRVDHHQRPRRRPPRQWRPGHAPRRRLGQLALLSEQRTLNPPIAPDPAGRSLVAERTPTPLDPGPRAARDQASGPRRPPRSIFVPGRLASREVSPSTRSSTSGTPSFDGIPRWLPRIQTRCALLAARARPPRTYQ